jgi:hypothetical protein
VILHHSIYEFLENIEPLTFVGVDALTLTGKSGLSAIGVRAAVTELKAKLETEPIKPFRFQGAEGFSQGPMRYAAKRDFYGKTSWVVLMVTGPLANDVVRWNALDLKATRIDFRVDVQMSKPCRDLAERLYKACNKRGRVISSLVGSTYYPTENRGGTYYGRIYDKSPEYGSEMGEVWRWEIEVKRQAANSLAETLLECHSPNEFIEDSVFGILNEQWGVPVPKAGLKPTVNYVGGSVISPEQKLDWIRRNVAKSVRELKRQGYQAELELLFNV